MSSSVSSGACISITNEQEEINEYGSENEDQNPLMIQHKKFNSVDTDAQQPKHTNFAKYTSNTERKKNKVRTKPKEDVNYNTASSLQRIKLQKQKKQKCKISKHKIKGYCGNVKFKIYRESNFIDQN